MALRASCSHRRGVVVRFDLELDTLGPEDFPGPRDLDVQLTEARRQLLSDASAAAQASGLPV